MTITFRPLVATLAAAYVVALATAAVTYTQTPAQAPARFDMAVRADFFAGFTGDLVRFERAMTLCETALASNPDHAEALVWHGAGALFRSGSHFQKGDMAKGGELWALGMAEMSRAVALDPNNVAVRIPRAATLLEASRQVPPGQAPALLKIVVDDYEKVLAIQEPRLDQLSDHARGELLFGLADGWARLGNQEKARLYFLRLTTSSAGSGRAAYAKAWLDGKPPADVGRCVGCH
jgi:hypothetical protein